MLQIISGGAVPLVADRALGYLSGVVLTLAPASRPVASALVTAINESTGATFNALSDREGRFRINDVPPGRFSVAAVRAGYVPVSLSARGLGSPGRIVTIDSTGGIDGFELRLMSGAVISGAVRRQTGEPLFDAQVALLRRSQGGNWTVAAPLLRTDATGRYRAFGVIPGEYLVLARMVGELGRESEGLSSREVDAALNDLRSGRIPTLIPKPSLLLAPTLYPSASTLAAASPVRLEPGEERVGVDIQLVRVHPSEIAGKIVAAKGGAVASAVELSLVTDDALGIPPQVVALGSDGAFRFSGVLPGQYGLIGSTRYIGVAPNPVAGGDPLNSEPAIWGFDSLVVTAGSDISGLSLTLRQPIRLSGNLTFEGSDPRPTAGAVVVEAWPAKGRILSTGLGTTVKPIRSRVRSDGTFEIDGLMPGDYRLAVAVDGRPASRPWTVSSASVRGQEVLDGWFSLRSDDVVVPVAVHLDDRPARLSGNLSLKSGAPARDNIVVAFTTNRAAWGKQSRRVVASRTDDHGAFVFDDLPAGEYRLGAVLDVMVGDLDDPAVLEALLDFTVIVSVRPGESVVQHLSVGGGVPASK